ncbi:unnamed protein product [Sympodiomycopsis kandeliae]
MAAVPPVPSTSQQQQQTVPQAVPDDLSVLLVTAGYDHTIRFWEAWSGICSRTIQYPDSQVNRLAISPDKRWLASCGVGVVRLYDCRSALGAGGGGQAALQPQHQQQGQQNKQQAQGGLTQPVASFEGHSGNVTCVAWHCEGKWLVSGGEDGMLRIWDTRSPRPQRVYDHRSPVNDVVVHPNQGELVSCDQAGSVKVWDLSENGCSHELVPEEDVGIRSVSVASDGSCLVAGNNKGNVYVWRIQTGIYPSQAETLEAGNSQGQSLEDGGGSSATDNQQQQQQSSNTANGNSGGADFTDLQPVTKFRAHDKYLIRCVLSPDVRHLATTSADTTVKIWSTSRYDFSLEKTLVGHQRWVWDCAFSADSAYLVTSSSDHVARLWELSSGETVRQYNGHNKAVVCCALNDSAGN